MKAVLLRGVPSYEVGSAGQAFLTFPDGTRLIFESEQDYDAATEWVDRQRMAGVRVGDRSRVIDLGCHRQEFEEYQDGRADAFMEGRIR